MCFFLICLPVLLNFSKSINTGNNFITQAIEISSEVSYLICLVRAIVPESDSTNLLELPLCIGEVLLELHKSGSLQVECTK